MTRSASQRHVGRPVDGGGLYRVALFRAAIGPTPARLAAFAAQTASLPRAITSIRRWQIATATPGEASGLHGWTHVWGQGRFLPGDFQPK